MPSILQYAYMQRALLVGCLLAVIVACLGTVMVHKRLSLIGDALSHSSLSGVALGLLLGFNPIVGAVAICIVSAFAIEAIRKKLGNHSEMAVAIVMSTGIGLAGVLSGFVKSAADFNSFLFGSIVAISGFETRLVVILAVIVLLAFILLYKELFYISFDEQAAAISGVPVGAVNAIFTILTAVTVSIAARTVGALIISSLMVVPVAAAMSIARSYRTTILWAVFVSITSTIGGLVLSFYLGLKPGGTIVLLSVAFFLVFRTIGFFRSGAKSTVSSKEV
ncbi:MAG: metal ABC transporter permease [Clostridiales bacterium]|nr:metal ABC transporter permease [Clostridiales bacterium]